MSIFKQLCEGLKDGIAHAKGKLSLKTTNLPEHGIQLFVTLSPSLPHFKRFVGDPRITGTRINSAMMYADEIDSELEIAQHARTYNRCNTLFFDVKARQLRITAINATDDHLEVTINHAIEVATPTVVLFKAGEDVATLARLVDHNHLIFENGPYYNVKVGESIHIRHPSLQILDETFPAYEVKKIHKVRPYFNHWVMSYVEGWDDVKAFRDIIGDDILGLKIENKRGIEFVQKEWHKCPNTFLIAAQGDMYVECDRPHEMLGAVKLIIDKDPEAWVGSRMLLSCINQDVPSASDFEQIAWLYDIGYRKMLLCDDLCITEEWLAHALNVFESFNKYYPNLLSS
jgi:hypothetical protein